MIINTDSTDAPELDVYFRLTEAQLRNRKEESKGLFIAESPKVVSVALGAGYEAVSLLCVRGETDAASKELIDSLPDVPAYAVTPEDFQKVTGFALTRGLLCAMKRKPPADPGDITRGAKRIAVLDGIADSTNVGAVFRSAAALGIDAVLCTKTCCDPLLRRSVRVSMGTVLLTPWAWIDGIDDVKSLGFLTAALALDENSVSIGDPRLKNADRLALVLGSEGYGLKREVIDACDYTAKIPMTRGVDSLNVAAAAAVAFWETRL
ncbi:MAG: RNA methyltransferase [Clostridia bacterium]|nr:RNA methyltransferase [Clostridia bacterium]